jgi:hypothetical protein
MPLQCNPVFEAYVAAPTPENAQAVVELINRTGPLAYRGQIYAVAEGALVATPALVENQTRIQQADQGGGSLGMR